MRNDAAPKSNQVRNVESFEMWKIRIFDNSWETIPWSQDKVQNNHSFPGIIALTPCKTFTMELPLFS